jgi:hypothetical protein
VNNLKEPERHKLEIDIADRILEEFGKQKQKVKDARFEYLQLKTKEQRI